MHQFMPNKTNGIQLLAESYDESIIILPKWTQCGLLLDEVSVFNAELSQSLHLFKMRRVASC